MSDPVQQDWLPRELVLEPDGHLSELALTAMADGETALLPAEALEHLQACGSCAERLGDASALAVLSAHALELEVERVIELDAVGERAARRDLALPRPAAATEHAAGDQALAEPSATSLVPVSSGRARRPLPRAAIAVALALAAIGAAPGALGAGSWLPSTVAAWVNGVPVVLRASWVMVRGLAAGNSLVLTATLWAAALVLGALGFWATRRTVRSTGEEA